MRLTTELAALLLAAASRRKAVDPAVPPSKVSMGRDGNPGDRKSVV